VFRYATNVLCLARGSGPACMGPPASILTTEMLQQLYGAPIRYHVHDAR